MVANPSCENRLGLRDARPALRNSQWHCKKTDLDERLGFSEEHTVSRTFLAGTGARVHTSVNSMLLHHLAF